ncbi:2-succinyl-5-enolpyruvyl-6-hydroxy-3-cyclohexene-1-carboxylic-acid synthase [Metabacillus sp. SLBN-84]
MSKSKSLTLYAANFADELAKAGVTEAVISPGSRSTPMAMLMAEHPDINIHLMIDERSAGFFALGLSKMLNKPVALLCTSGTAAANYYPAVVEAFYSRVPLLILTADRPHELRDVGAPQAIDQIHFFGRYAKWFADMAIPEQTEGMLAYSRMMAARAAGKAMSSPAGPVHLNLPFREPLIPDFDLEDIWKNGSGRTHHVTIKPGQAVLQDLEIERIAEMLSGKEKGLIVCGEIRDPLFTDAVLKLSAALKYPILADPLSNLRTGSHDKSAVIDGYDAFMKDDELANELKPDVILRFGAMPVSKPLFLFLKRSPEILQLVVDGQGGFREPTLLASEMLECDESWFCESLSGRVSTAENEQWLKTWQQTNSTARKILSSPEDGPDDLFEGKVFTELQKAMPEKSHMFVGNSMPIRDADNYFLNSNKNISVHANRGANGIDGVVSTALGMSAGTEDPLFLVIGDLSFYHDMNGLLAAKMHKLDMTVILLNNDGGGIFSFLPQSKEEKHFETLFGTPTGLHFQHAASLYDAAYTQPETWEAFRDDVENAARRKGLNIIEVRTNRHSRVTIHRNLMNRVSQEIREMLRK